MNIPNLYLECRLRTTESQISNNKIEITMHSISNTIPGWIKHWADRQPDASALLSPTGKLLTYSDLYLEILHYVNQLQTAGLNKSDRVALIFPNGIDLAVALLGTASSMTCIPVNPALREPELRSYLELTEATAILVPENGIDMAKRIAGDLRLPVISLSSVDEQCREPGNLLAKLESANSGMLATENDIAILLPTSGTTSQPKAVIVSHYSVCADAGDIHRWLRLDNQDRVLGLMPLYHVHALIAGLFASMLSGGSFISTPGYTPDGFFEWLNEFQPTWYSAVPTVHQSIVDHASDSKNQSIIQNHRLRFARSAAAPLPIQLLNRIENTFGIPLIETYGMTELRTFITANPLPPNERKPGSVGKRVGHKIGIIGPDGRSLPLGKSGEIVVFTEAIDIRNYVHEESAYTSTHEVNYFQTGDVGKLDHEGFLFITGRIKETIIRGGVNVSPLEIETALMKHPEVVEAVAFPTLHNSLGQDIAAAVLLRKGSVVDAREMREHAFQYLADFKVPSQVVVVDQIPRSPMGKVKRLKMEKLLGTELKPKIIDGQSDTERTLSTIFSEILGISKVGINDNFFALGGDSLQGDRVINRVNHFFNTELTPDVLFRHPTIAELTGEISVDNG